MSHRTGPKRTALDQVRTSSDQKKGRAPRTGPVCSRRRELLVGLRVGRRTRRAGRPTMRVVLAPFAAMRAALVHSRRTVAIGVGPVEPRQRPRAELLGSDLDRPRRTSARPCASPCGGRAGRAACRDKAGPCLRTTWAINRAHPGPRMPRPRTHGRTPRERSGRYRRRRPAGTFRVRETAAPLLVARLRFLAREAAVTVGVGRRRRRRSAGSLRRE